MKLIKFAIQRARNLFADTSKKNGGCASLDAPTTNRNILEISNRHHFLIGFLPFLAPPIFMERMAQPRLPPR